MIVCHSTRPIIFIAFDQSDPNHAFSHHKLWGRVRFSQFADRTTSIKMTTCCCRIPENVTSETCCPPTCCPKSCCVVECKTEACKACGCCATTCPCCVAQSKKVREEGLAPHPQCECASTVLSGTESRTKCGCPLIVVCGCGDKCEKCSCGHGKITEAACTKKEDGNE